MVNVSKVTTLMRVSRKAFIQTLRLCDGVVSQTAKSLCISPQAVRKRLRDDTALQSIASESRESLIDLAQSKLRPLIESGDFRAIRFVLETWGRGRGFGKEIKIESVEPQARVVLYLPDNGRNPGMGPMANE